MATKAQVHNIIEAIDADIREATRLGEENSHNAARHEFQQKIVELRENLAEAEKTILTLQRENGKLRSGKELAKANRELDELRTLKKDMNWPEAKVDDK